MQIALLLIDIKLTPEMNGQDLAKSLRQQATDLPVLFLSGYYQTTNADWIDQWPGCSYLQKPFRAATLIEAVEAVLGDLPLQIG
jgi:FixJ family two-component response regulator